MTKIILDEMKKTRNDLRNLLTSVQNASRLNIRIMHGDGDLSRLVEKVLELEAEAEADVEMMRIIEDLSDIVGKLFLAGVLKRAVICDAVVAHQAESMLDSMQHVALNWVKLMESGTKTINEDIRILVDSMLQNRIVMLEKTIDILDGKDVIKHSLKFIQELDQNINQANITAHESLLS